MRWIGRDFRHSDRDFTKGLTPGIDRDFTKGLTPGIDRDFSPLRMPLRWLRMAAAVKAVDS